MPAAHGHPIFANPGATRWDIVGLSRQTCLELQLQCKLHDSRRACIGELTKGGIGQEHVRMSKVNIVEGVEH